VLSFSGLTVGSASSPLHHRLTARSPVPVNLLREVFFLEYSGDDAGLICRFCKSGACCFADKFPPGIAPPGGTNTYANGSNPQGDIVGRYTGADEVVHGFLLRRFIETANPFYSAASDFSATSNPNSVWSYDVLSRGEERSIGANG
jgi:hypothetical protein